MNYGRCGDLRVEYLREPLSVGCARPRYSWLIGRAQEAYEIVVSRADDGAPVWQSGKVACDRSSLVEHRGEDLAGCTAYEWSVRIWSDRSAEPGPWVTSRFETGPLTAADWQAAWVAPVQRPTAVERWTLRDWITGKRPAEPLDERLRPVQLLRQQLTISRPVKRARLAVTAHGVYAAEINGETVGDEVLAPGFDSYAHRVSAQTYDVTGLLADGENVLGLALADGWWAGRIGLSGSSAQWGATTAASWQLQIDYADGPRETIVSGRDVTSAPGPWRYADLFVGEHFDRRAVPHGWSRPGFDDRAWSKVEVADEPVDAIVPFTGEPIRRVAELPALTVTGDAESGWVIDFGQVVAGRVRITMPQLVHGQEVTIEHTETLTPDGAWFDNIAGINKEQTDVYIASGEADGETYEPTFTFHGFRYARVRGVTVAPKPDEMVAVVLSSDLPVTGSFETDDARLNRLHQNVVWSQRGNFLSIPTDCPQRERAGWTGDIQVFAAAASNNAMVAPFLTRWLANVRADQLPDGRVPIISPYSPRDAEDAREATGLGAIVAAAGWSDAIAIVPWVLYERYGDVRVLEENYLAILRWIDYQTGVAATGLPDALAGVELAEDRLARQRLLYNTGDHFGDWLTPSTLAGRPLHEAIMTAPQLTSELVAPMFQARTLTIASRIASVLGHAEDAAELERRATAVRAAFTAEYVAEDGSLPVELQGLYALAIAFEMTPEDLRPRLGKRLAGLVAANGNRLDTGFLSVPYLLDALWDTGHRDLARAVLWQSEPPSWLYEVDHGATTIWETWDAVAPDGTVRETSLNHYAFGCVDDWLYRRVAGISAAAPGYRSVVIEPDLDCGLDRVSAHVDTVHGRVAVRWSRRDGAADLEVTVPPGVDAVLIAADRRAIVPSGTSYHTI